MGDQDDPARPPATVPPKLPDVESPPPEELLDGVPSPEEVVERAAPAERILDEQPSVDEILRRER